MRYYLLVNRRPEGPYDVPELLARPDFDGASMVCFVGATSADAWRAAERMPELAQALAERALASDAPVEPAAEPGAEGDAAAEEPAAEPVETAAPEAEAAIPPETGEAQQWVQPEPAAEGAEPAAEGMEAPAAEGVEPVVEGASAPPDDAAADAGAEPAAVQAAADDADAEAAAPVDDNPARRLIMIVDDDAEFRTVLSAGVKKEGFRVVTAEDGKDAEGKLEPFTPDLVVTDLMMPRMGGYELIRAMQAAGHGDIPVIVVNGHPLDPTTVSSLRMEGKVLDFFTKPVSVGAVVNLIHDSLGTRRLSPRQKLEQEKNDGWSSGA